MALPSSTLPQRPSSGHSFTAAPPERRLSLHKAPSNTSGTPPAADSSAPMGFGASSSVFGSRSKNHKNDERPTPTATPDQHLEAQDTDLFAPGPMLKSPAANQQQQQQQPPRPPPKSAEREAATALAQTQSGESAPSPSSPLQRNGSLLSRLSAGNHSKSAGSLDGGSALADTASLKALSQLGVVPTKSPKAASVLTGYQPTSPSSPHQHHHIERKDVVSFASSEFDLSPDEGPGFSGGAETAARQRGVSTTSSRLPPRNFKPSQASSLSSPIAPVLLTKHASIAAPALSPIDRNSNMAAAPAAANNGLSGSSKTLACAYIVGGLPKQPAHWSLAEHDSPPAHSEGALDRWWKPEVLGSSVVGEHISLDDLDGGKEAITKRTGKKSFSKGKGKPGGAQSATVGVPELSPAEVAKIQAKALKLSFTRECEVLASTLAPPASSHYFSFTVPVADDEHTATGPGGAGQAFDLIINSTTARQSFTASESRRFYAVSLQIWSHADKSRAAQIRQSLEGGQRKERAHAMKAASQGRRLGKKLESKLASSSMSVHSTAETDVETDAFMSETDADLPRPAASTYNNALPLWLPYHLILVSRWPLFDLMTDYLRVHWARFNTAIAQHSMAMSQLLNTPAPRPGGAIKVSAGAPDVVFCAQMPGKMDIANEGFVESNNTCWPLFSCLSADNLLTICEVALSPMGRVIFFSRHPIMLSMAVETLTYILELKGWSTVGGVAHHQVHARDIRLLVEDPGPYILGVHASCKSIANAAPKEVLKVDLDMDELECGRFHPGALSIGRQREKDIKALEAAIDRPTSHSPGVPREWAEAYPAGRFRPLSIVEANGRVTSAERLLPPSNWTFNPTSVFAAFDNVLSKQPASGFVSLFKKQVPRRPSKLDPSTAHVQSMIRSHTSTFVNRRDHLETKLWKLNRRMNSLASEAASWAKTYETFSAYSKSLAKQQEELKNRLDREKKEARRLSAQVSEQKQSHTVLSKRLEETEEARATAERELLEASRVREELEAQRQQMIQELSTAMISGMDDDRPSSVASVPIHANGDAQSHRRSASLGSVSSSTVESVFSEDGLNPEERRAMESRQAAQEAMAKMQARLQSVLRMAKNDDFGSVRSISATSASGLRMDTSEDESSADEPQGLNRPRSRELRQVPPSPRSSYSHKSSSKKTSLRPSPDGDDSGDHTESLRNPGTTSSEHKKKKDLDASPAGSDSSTATTSTRPSVPAISINGNGRSASSSPVAVTRPILIKKYSADKSNSDTDATEPTTTSKPPSSKSAKRRSYQHKA